MGKKTAKFVMLVGRNGPNVNDQMGDVVELETGKDSESERMMNASPPHCRPVRDGVNPEVTAKRRRRLTLKENVEQINETGEKTAKAFKALGVEEREKDVAKAEKKVGKDPKKADDVDLQELETAKAELEKVKAKALPIEDELGRLRDKRDEQAAELEELEAEADKCDDEHIAP